MKVSADPAQKTFVRFDRRTPRTDENRTLRLDRLVASPNDAVKRCNLQQRHSGNSDPTSKTGGVKISLQQISASKELRYRNDAIAFLAMDRSIDFEERDLEIAYQSFGLVARNSELSRHLIFEGFLQVRIGPKVRVDNISCGRVTTVPSGRQIFTDMIWRPNSVSVKDSSSVCREASLSSDPFFSSSYRWGSSKLLT
jgi:hypothetical protein